jgi:type IV secretion system protein TrbL
MSCEWYNPLSYGSCASDVAKSAAGDAFNAIAESFGQAADHAVSWLWGQLGSATTVHLGGAGFGLEVGITATIAGTVGVGLFVIQLIQSVLRRDAGGLGRAVRGLLVAFIGGGLAIAVVNLLLGATDSLCAGVVRVATGTDVTGLGKLILGAGALTSAVTGPAALLLLSLACILATTIVYCALVVRKVLIVVTAVFAPIAFAGSLADLTVSWTRRWIETTLALVVSKLVLVLVFVTGYGILVEGVGQAGTGATQKVTQVISGVIVLFLAGFAPWLALKVVHFTGEHAQHLHALGAGAAGGVAATGRMAQRAAPYVARGAMPGLAGGEAAGTGGPSGGIGTPPGDGEQRTGGGPAGRGADGRDSGALVSSGRGAGERIATAGVVGGRPVATGAPAPGSGGAAQGAAEVGRGDRACLAQAGAAAAGESPRPAPPAAPRPPRQPARPIAPRGDE